MCYKRGEPRTGSPPYLFGYVIDENVKKAFEKTRNMKLFKFIEKDVKKKEFIIIQNEMVGGKIDFYEFLTKDKNHLSGRRVVVLPATTQEATRVYLGDEVVFNRLARFTSAAMLAVKEPYKSALKELGYYAIFHWYSGSKMYFQNEDADMSMFYDKNILIDQMALFIEYYGDTLK